MARKTNHQYERKKREQARQERAAARRARKRARGSSPGGSAGEEEATDDEPGIRKSTDAEIQAAIERAMNPGAVRKQARERQGRGGGARLFVGNLDFGIDEQELRELFSQGGFKVVSATVVKDRDTGRARGFAFVELEGSDEAAKAMDALDGTEFAGRELRVNPADQR